MQQAIQPSTKEYADDDRRDQLNRQGQRDTNTTSRCNGTLAVLV